MSLVFECSKLLIVATLAGCLTASDNGKSSSPTGLAAIEIDGATFSLADLQRKGSGALFQARNALFEAERKAADEFINDYLLDREAKKEKITVEQLLERHAYSTFKEPSEEALRVYYDGLDTTESFDAVRDKIRDVIRQRRMTKAKTAYVKSLRSQANVTLRLAPPRAQFTAENTPVRGSSAAAVTVVEFADYECPYCQQIQPAIAKLQADYKDRIAFVYKDVPLPMHAHAQKAAEAAHCAGDQGKYWEYHDLLFASKQYDVAQLKEHARTLKLDGKAFDQCLDSGAQAERIKTTVAEAQSIGLPGTPGFFINGRFINGAVDYQILQQIIEEELRATSSSMAEARKQVEDRAKNQD
jgi:protein-disulfide isomerase